MASLNFDWIMPGTEKGTNISLILNIHSKKDECKEKNTKKQSFSLAAKPCAALQLSKIKNVLDVRTAMVQ